jgi:hypothetical protein
MQWKEITALWSSYNRILLKVIEHMDTKALGNVWIIDDKKLTLEFIVNDYYRHLDWHIGHLKKGCGRSSKDADLSTVHKYKA